MKRYLATILLLFVCGGAFANYTEIDIPPLRDDVVLSTNWLATVKAVMPSAPATAEWNFQAATNFLSRESERGNITAQGLWGFFVLVQSRSPKEARNGLNLLRNSATNGFVPAMLNLGLLLTGGVYVEQNYAEAFHWFSEAAEKGNSEAMLQLGGCYHYGLGTTKDVAKAAGYYRRAAELTNYVAMKSLGYLLMNGLGVEKDTSEAKHWLMRAAKEGNNRRAMYNLGVLCCTNVSDTNAMSEAFQWFKQSAELGDGLACEQLAIFYKRGWSVVQTNIEAFRFWRNRAAILGATAAQYEMGAAYRTGDGVPKDTKKSLAWYRMAAAKNHPSALYDLALHYLQEKTNRLSHFLAETHMLQAAQAGHREAQFQCALSSFRGDIGAPDCETGKQWLTKAAENGWGRAEFVLFQLYYNGIAPSASCPAFPKDVPEAVKWLRRAAEHENLQAQPILAVMLIKGRDVETNKVEAERLLRKGAEHGYAPSQNDLGFAILNGDTGRTDLMEAAMWCRLAQSQATDTNVLQWAEVNLNNILSKLNPDQRVEVDERVKKFSAVPVDELDPLVKDWEANPAYQQEDGRGGI